MDKEIINYLRLKQCFCFRKNIIWDLSQLGFKRTNIINSLRQMRKDKALRLYRRRWGLGFGML